MTTWTPLTDFETRPVAIVGAGVLGRRLAVMWASRGGAVHLCDKIESVREQARIFFDETIGAVMQEGCSQGTLNLYDDLEACIDTAWIVIESIPENLEMKTELFGTLDKLTDPKVILATNSSSYKSSEMISKVTHTERVCNIHAFSPPKYIPCEIMTCGKTDAKVLDFVYSQTKVVGFKPFLVRKESTGFIYNRIWAAIKREALFSLAEGTATASEIDDIFRTRLHTPQGPFEIMDGAGLDTVLNIEEHYAAERVGLPEEPRQILRDYVSKGWLGKKSGKGFYDYQ